MWRGMVIDWKSKGLFCILKKKMKIHFKANSGHDGVSNLWYQDVFIRPMAFINLLDKLTPLASNEKFSVKITESIKLYNFSITII